MDATSKFILDTVSVLAKHNFKVSLTHKRSIEIEGEKGTFVTGYVNYKPNMFGLAYGVNHRMPVPEDYWLWTFVHESCHVDQALEGIDLWKRHGWAGNVYMKYMNGENVKQSKVDEAFHVIQQLELDCEKRSVKKMKKYGLPIDTELYIKSSNAYILSYNAVKWTKNWKSIKKVFNKDVIAVTPSKFLRSYTKIPQPLIEFYQPLQPKD